MSRSSTYSTEFSHINATRGILSPKLINISPFITCMTKNILNVTAFRKKFQLFFIPPKSLIFNPFITYMAFLFPNVTAISKFLQIFFKCLNSFPRKSLRQIFSSDKIQITTANKRTSCCRKIFYCKRLIFFVFYSTLKSAHLVLWAAIYIVAIDKSHLFIFAS